MKKYLLFLLLISINVQAQFYGSSQDLNSDQILNPISKSVVFGIPFRTNSQMSFEFYLKFKDKSEVIFDNITQKNDVYTLGFSLIQYKSLIKTYRGQVAKLVVKEKSKKIVSHIYWWTL